MHTAIRRLNPGAWLLPLLAGLWLALTGLAAQAEDDPPGRVGRLAEVQGKVSWFDHEQGQWTTAQRNLPLTRGDRVSTGPDGRGELRVGSTTVRLAAQTEIELLRLDDERISLRLHTGSLALRLRSREVAEELDLVTGEARFLPIGTGHFRLDRQDDTTRVGSWQGELRIDDPAGFIVVGGQRVELFRQPGNRALRFKFVNTPDDAFALAVLNDEQRDSRSVSAQYVSPEMTGVEELDRAGRWEQHPEYGSIWLPLRVSVGWAPYRDGRWVWVRPWGWTWVDNAPWGFAPFHYGRWVNWRGGWAWVPGPYVARPVYSPALVAWAGPPGLRFQFSIGGPGYGWAPLAPREIYVPRYRASPAYGDRFNHHPPIRPGWDGRDGRDSRDGWRDDRERREFRERFEREERERRDRSERPGRPDRNERDDRTQRDQRDQRPEIRPEPFMGPQRPGRAVEAPREPREGREGGRDAGRDSGRDSGREGGRDGGRDNRPAPPAQVAPQPAPAAAPMPARPAVERPPERSQQEREAAKEREPRRSDNPGGKAGAEVREAVR